MNLEVSFNILYLGRKKSQLAGVGSLAEFEIA
jgi:hypothetical protein